MKLVTSYLLFLLISGSSVHADEGMWLPILLKQLNEADMKAKGLKLSAEDIYSINKTSLKDAVVHFGGGCTGEIISSEGLLLTNHHCGFGQIQSHSSVEKDYLTNGYWAMTREQELTNPGLTATFIVRMEDVTQKVLQNVTASFSEFQRDSAISSNIKRIQKEAVTGTHYDALIRPFYYGNEYYMFITETFKDIRLVGAPPSSIGKFGGDTDNWMWPRHTGDFSIFRIYAGKDNKPAEYSKDNVPYKPKHFFPISIKGIKENDFTMVYGFPGRTQEYLPSYAVDLIMNYSDPARVEVRTKRLAIWDEWMKKSDTTRIQYAAKHASVSNAWKKWIGEVRGLKKLDAVARKQTFEKQFQERVDRNEKFAGYRNLLPRYKAVYAEITPLTVLNDYYSEAAFGIELVGYARSFQPLVSASKNPGATDQELTELVKKAQQSAEIFYKDYNARADEQVFAELMAIYYKRVQPSLIPDFIHAAVKRHNNDFYAWAREVFNSSIVASREKVNRVLSAYKKSNVNEIQEDPAFKIMTALQDHYQATVAADFQRLNSELGILHRTYMKAQREVMPEKKYYPDANSTLRVAYGKVDDYRPRDGVHYDYYTTLDGIMEKADSSHEDFIVPAKLYDLYNKKDYGQYSSNGTVPVSFIASNHTTGGNSGSPVLNGEGHLIGTNYDRNWEGTMSDIMYDPNQVRNIILDVRYTLFIIDKFAGAGHLLGEMKIVK